MPLIQLPTIPPLENTKLAAPPASTFQCHVATRPLLRHIRETPTNLFTMPISKLRSGKKCSSLDNPAKRKSSEISTSGRQLRNCTNLRVRLPKLVSDNFIKARNRSTISKTMSEDGSTQEATNRRRKSSADKEQKFDENDENCPPKRTVTPSAMDDELNNISAMEVDEVAVPEMEDALSDNVADLEDSADKAAVDESIKDSTIISTTKTPVSGICLKSQVAKAPSKPTHIIDQLSTLFSNLYLNSVHRLCAEFPPRCAEDMEFCRENHYHKLGPDVPSEALKIQLRCTLQQQRYESFVNLVNSMCQRGQFPGEDTLTTIIELLLCIDHTPSEKSESYKIYDKSIELFSNIVRTFPPCWRAMRSAYIGFFQRPLDTIKINSELNGERLSRSTKMFDILLDLLERELKDFSTADEVETMHTPNKNSEVVTQEFSSPMLETSGPWDGSGKAQVHTFLELSPARRLSRLFMVLHLLLQIMESDFVMWLLHHFRKKSSWIFYNDSRPLVVFVMGMTEEAYLSSTSRQIFKLFAMAVNKGLPIERLKVLERYISLLMVVSNTADIEHTVLGVRYPYLGSKTKQLITDFFKKFKEQNLTASISSYINAIELLRIPYVRYTFIDEFLQMFDFAQTDSFTPEKVLYHMKKKHWLKYKPHHTLLAIEEDELSREQYLKLLLDALRAYCEWHACHEMFQVITKKTTISSITISTDSVHRTPTPGGGLLMLNKMTKDIEELEQMLRMKVRMSKPKIELPRVDMCIDKELTRSYCCDLKNLYYLQQMVTEQSEANPATDMNEWLTFLAQFKEGDERE